MSDIGLVGISVGTSTHDTKAEKGQDTWIPEELNTVIVTGKPDIHHSSNTSSIGARMWLNVMDNILWAEYLALVVTHIYEMCFALSHYSMFTAPIHSF